MTLRKDARDILERHFQAGWNEKTPVTLENVLVRPQTGSPFVQLLLEWTASRQPALQPGRIQRFYGDFIVLIFVPVGGGLALAEELAADATAILSQRIVGGITLKSSDCRVRGAVPPATFWQARIITPFIFDEIAHDPM